MRSVSGSSSSSPHETHERNSPFDNEILNIGSYLNPTKRPPAAHLSFLRHSRVPILTISRELSMISKIGWIRRLLARLGVAPARAIRLPMRRGYRPSFEQLETRLAPATITSASNVLTYAAGS